MELGDLLTEHDHLHFVFTEHDHEVDIVIKRTGLFTVSYIGINVYSQGRALWALDISCICYENDMNSIL